MSKKIYQFLLQTAYRFFILNKKIILGLIWFIVADIIILSTVYELSLIASPPEERIDIMLIRYNLIVRVTMIVLFSMHFFVSRRVMTYMWMLAFIIIFVAESIVPGISDAHNLFLD